MKERTTKQKTVQRLSILMLAIFIGIGSAAVWINLPQSAEATPSDVVCVKLGGGDGCFGTIQAGLEAADAFDTVRVSGGIFVENVVISRYVTLEGGWNSDFSVRDVEQFSTTIRSAGNDKPVVTIRQEGSIISAATKVVDGFYVTGGNNTGGYGGGISIRWTDAVVRNSVIFSNTGYYLGGGIYAFNGNVTLQNNRVFSNVVLPSGNEGFGGGIQIESATAQLIDNIVSSNVISANGGFGAGIDVLDGRVSIVDSQVFSNSHTGNPAVLNEIGSGFGGGLAVHTGSSVVISGTTFSGNSARSGAGIHNSGVISLTGSTLMNNRARLSAGAVFNKLDATVYLAHSLVFSNSADNFGHGVWNLGTMSARNSIMIQPEGDNCTVENGGMGIQSLGHNLESGFTCGLKASKGDFAGNALSLNVTFDAEKGANYAQTDTSVLIDAGSNEGCPAVDVNGTSRPLDGNGDGIAICDIGPIEYVKTGTDIVYAVTTAADEDDGTCAPDDCSLREAINAANAHPGADTVRMGAFDAGAGLFIDSLLGQMTISDDLTLLCEFWIPLNATGSGGRYFEIENGANVTMQGCTIQGGMAADRGGGVFINGGGLTLIDSFVRLNYAQAEGGGIAVKDGRLTLINSEVENNRTDGSGGGISSMGTSVVNVQDDSVVEQNSGRTGGGIFNAEAGLVTLDDSTVFSNTAVSGGGIYNSGQLDLVDGFVSQNVASEVGGGIYNMDGSVVIRRTKPRTSGGKLLPLTGFIQRNSALAGGGIFSTGPAASVLVRNSDVVRNEGTISGGGILIDGGQLHLLDGTKIRLNVARTAGGVLVREGDATIEETIFDENEAEENGGGIAIFNDGSAVIKNTDFESNVSLYGKGGGLYTAGTLTLTQSGVFANEGSKGFGIYVAQTGVASIQNSSIYLNRSSARTDSDDPTVNAGGGIFIDSGKVSILHTTIVHNQAERGAGLLMLGDDGDDGKGGLNPPQTAEIKIGNSIIALNGPPKMGGGAAPFTDCTFLNGLVDFEQLGPNLSESDSCPGVTEGETRLSDVRGPASLSVMRLLEGSDGIDAAADGLCAAVGNVDQRNAPRPYGPKCDLGAYEFGSTVPEPLDEVQVYLPIVQRP